MLDWLLLPAHSYVVSQWIFLKFLAVNYLFAFCSLLIQVKGLFGQKGITPIQDFVKSFEQPLQSKIFLRFPSLFWWKSSDAFLQGSLIAGIIFSVLILIGAPCASFLFLMNWFIYLSFMTMDSTFLSFQWDCLLLEIGFIAIFFALQTPPLWIYIVLIWFLLFRFMFASGFVKLMASTPEWRRLNAMHYHYETQPLPNKFAYYAHLLPAWFNKLSVLLVLFLEIIVPFFIFSPDEIRLGVCVLLILLQVFIALTGNYAFFNTLSVTLCFPLVSDQYWGKLHSILTMSQNSDPSVFVQVILFAVGLMLLLLNVGVFLNLFFPVTRLMQVVHFFSSYYLVNSYGLFANMTTKRPEIIIEGSEDGIHWKPYEFKWKPGNLSVAPKQVAPHQPRLDWQMWFAALSRYEYQTWFTSFLIRLLQGSTDVLKLLKINPFPHRPPRFIRAVLYEYHFNSLRSKYLTKEWWRRELKRTYMPVISLSKRQKISNEEA